CPVDIVNVNEAPEPILGEVLKGQRLLGDDTAYAPPAAYRRFYPAAGKNTEGKTRPMDTVVLIEKHIHSSSDFPRQAHCKNQPIFAEYIIEIPSVRRYKCRVARQKVLLR
nr:hypothetical protein [Nitrosomonas sp.]